MLRGQPPSKDTGPNLKAAFRLSDWWQTFINLTVMVNLKTGLYWGPPPPAFQRASEPNPSRLLAQTSHVPTACSPTIGGLLVLLFQTCQEEFSWGTNDYVCLLTCFVSYQGPSLLHILEKSIFNQWISKVAGKFIFICGVNLVQTVWKKEGKNG